MDPQVTDISGETPSAGAEISLLNVNGHICHDLADDVQKKSDEAHGQETAMGSDSVDRDEKRTGGEGCPALDDLSGLVQTSSPQAYISYDALLTLLGEFGRYQQWVCSLLYLVSITGAMQILLSVFTMAVPDHRCSLPGVLNDTWQVQSAGHAALINASIPPGVVSEGARQLSRCSRYPASSTGPSEFYDPHPGAGNGSAERGSGMWVAANSSRSAGSKDTAAAVAAGSTDTCGSYVYDRSVYASTIVTELDLVCDRKAFRSHMQMVLMVGSLLGNLLFGIASDRWGRKRILMASLIFHLAAAFTIPLLRNYATLLIVHLLNGMSLSGLFGPAYVLCMELVGPSKRVWPGFGTMSFWSLGMMAVAPLAYWLRDWTHLHLATASAAVPLLALWWLVPESPRWLLSQKRVAEAEKIIARAARVNKVTLPPGLLDKVRVTVDEKAAGGESVWRHCFSVRLVVRHLIIFLTWFASGLTYYGLSWNVGTLGGSAYVNMALSGAVELVAYALCILLLDRIGRRALCCGQLVLAGLMCTATVLPVSLAPQSLQWLTVFLAMLGKLGIAGAFSTIYIFAIELFPTVLRSSGLAVCAVCAGLGGVAAPYIANLGDFLEGDAAKAVPLVIFGITSMVVGILQFFLPETLGRRLPDTVEDVANMGRKSAPDRQGKKQVTDTKSAAA